MRSPGSEIVERSGPALPAGPEKSSGFSSVKGGMKYRNARNPITPIASALMPNHFTNLFILTRGGPPPRWDSLVCGDAPRHSLVIADLRFRRCLDTRTPADRGAESTF